MQRWMGRLAAGAALLAAGVGHAQTANATMVVTVVNQQSSPAQPVGNVGINVSFLNGSQKITAAMIHTNREGQVALTITADAQASGDLRIDIYDAPGLVIYQPAEGMVGAAQQQLTLKLLPKGSPALLEPAKIEAMLNRLSRLTLQNQQLQVQLSQAQQEQKPDFDAMLTEWATENGFSYDEVNQKVQGWSQEVLAHRQEKSLTEQAEAELGLRDYADAATLFAGAAAASDDALDREQQQYLAQRRTELRNSLVAHWQSVTAFLLAGQYPNALAQAAKAQSQAAQEHEHFPDDAVLRSYWIGATVILNVNRLSAASSDGTLNGVTEISNLLKSLGDLLAQMDKTKDYPYWSWAQTGCSMALFNLAQESSDRAAIDYLRQAEAHAKEAAAAFDKEKDPDGWAIAEWLEGAEQSVDAGRESGPQSPGLAKTATENLRAALALKDKISFPQAGPFIQISLGFALAIEALRANDATSRDLAAQSVAAMRAAVESCDKTRDPRHWAVAENGLATVLSDQGELADSSHAGEILAQADAAFEEVLTVQTKASDPGGWATTQQSLADVLKSEAGFTNGGPAKDLIGRSIAAFQAALSVITKESSPITWAQVESSLGDALESDAKLTPGAGGVALLAQAADANRAALQVYTRADDPEKWAIAEGQLGDALQLEAKSAQGTAALNLLAQGADAEQAALEIFTPDRNPETRARVQMVLGDDLTAEGSLTGGEQGIAEIRQAVDAYRGATEFFSQQSSAEQWATIQQALGYALELEGKLTQGTAGVSFLAQGADAERAALTYFTQAVDPEKRARVQMLLGDDLVAEGDLTGGDQGLAELQEAAGAYRAAAQFFTKETAPGQWASLQEVLGTVLETIAVSAKGGPSTDVLRQAAEAWSSALTVDSKNAELAEGLSALYHEWLMDFSRAYELDKQAEQEDGSDDYRLDLAEASLTVGHFDECLAMANSVDAAKLSAAQAPARQTLVLACEWGAGDKSAARTAAGFAAYKAGVEKSGWATNGDRTYLASAPQFSANRAAWIKLFQSLQDGDGAGMADAAGTLGQGMNQAAR
jgi:hypothetical protein